MSEPSLPSSPGAPTTPPSQRPRTDERTKKIAEMLIKFRDRGELPDEANDNLERWLEAVSSEVRAEVFGRSEAPDGRMAG